MSEQCFACVNSKVYSEHQTSKIELFVAIVNGYQLHLRCLTKFSIRFLNLPKFAVIAQFKCIESINKNIW